MRPKLCSMLLACLFTLPLLVGAQQVPAAGIVMLATPASGAAAPCGVADTSTPRPMPSEYIIGEGDLLKINVWKEPDVSLNMVTVRPDGMVSMPLLGVIKVSGQSPSQIQSDLTSRLSRYLSHPQVTVTVAEIKSKSVYITGEVGKPGVYPLISPIGVIQAIVMAGGTTPYAHRKSIYVLRSVAGREQKLTVDYVRLLHGESSAANIDLQPGDTVVVP